MNNFQLEKRQKRNPMAEYLMQLQLLVTNTEFKDKDRADQYETLDMKMNGLKYCAAYYNEDSFDTYVYDPTRVYEVLMNNGIPEERVPYYVQNVAMIPMNVKNILYQEAHDQFLATYEETNPYYVMLMGIPYPGSTFKNPEEIMTIPDEFFEIYQSQNVLERGMAVHEMPLKYQELFMNSKYYTKMLAEHPEHQYLKYLGSKAIPVHISRRAHDGDIMQINTDALSTSHPIFGNVSVDADLVHLFMNQYVKVHRYIYGTLRGDFNDIYPNYNSLVRFLTIYMAIGSCMNELMKKSASMIYMNQSTANDFFMLYGLPSVIMEGSGMMEFLKQFRLILMDKGTNIVYRVKDLIGFEYTDIYTLVMVKQQVFENGKPKYTTDENGKRVPVSEIVFRRLGTTDDNTSYFKFRDSRISYDWESIASGDPRWWNSPEVEAMLYDMNYTLSNSKYIQLSTHLSMTDIYWQCVILIRGLLDNRYETEHINLPINMNLCGQTELSVFEAVLILEILMNWHIMTKRKDCLHGDIYQPNGMYDGKAACIDMLFNGLEPDGMPKPLVPGSPYKVSSFDFDLINTKPLFWETLSNTDYYDYLEPDVLVPMLNRIYAREENNIGESLMGDVRKVYDYLERKLMNCVTIHQFRQVTDAFNAIFLVDPVRDWYDEGMIDTDAYLRDTYNLSEYELSSLKAFFDEDDTEFTITMDEQEYPINLYQVLNNDVTDIVYGEEPDTVYPFRDTRFVSLFESAMRTYVSIPLEESQISPNVKTTYQKVIMDKVILDTGNGTYGPKTFEALLFRNDPDMYRYLISLRTDGEALLLILRALVKSLESYTNASLRGLEFAAIGEENYFQILKEVIGYFKSYMVEFTKEEFVYIFDGLFDNGGNSNMLNLYDERAHTTLRMIVKDSLTLHDNSHAVNKYKLADYGLRSMYDGMIVRHRAAYKKIRDMGYEIWFDTGRKITQNPDNPPADDDKVIFSLCQDGDTQKVHIYL